MNAMPPAKTRLIVVRHGETAWNLDGRQQGQFNSDLTELGCKQAHALAAALAAEPIHALYSSEVGRALQTAQIIADKIGLKTIPEPRLRERHLGIAQGLTLENFKKQHPHPYAQFRRDPDYPLPNGESARQRFDRAIACAQDHAAQNRGRTLLFVTHGGIVDSFFRHTLNLPLNARRCYSLFNAAINIFTLDETHWKLETWGQTSHLHGLPTLDDW